MFIVSYFKVFCLLMIFNFSIIFLIPSATNASSQHVVISGKVKTATHNKIVTLRNDKKQLISIFYIPITGDFSLTVPSGNYLIDIYRAVKIRDTQQIEASNNISLGELPVLLDNERSTFETIITHPVFSVIFGILGTLALQWYLKRKRMSEYDRIFKDRITPTIAETCASLSNYASGGDSDPASVSNSLEKALARFDSLKIAAQSFGDIPETNLRESIQLGESLQAVNHYISSEESTNLDKHRFIRDCLNNTNALQNNDLKEAITFLRNYASSQ